MEGVLLAILPAAVVGFALVANYLWRVRANGQRTMSRR